MSYIIITRLALDVYTAELSLMLSLLGYDRIPLRLIRLYALRMTPTTRLEILTEGTVPVPEPERWYKAIIFSRISTYRRFPIESYAPINVPRLSGINNTTVSPWSHRGGQSVHHVIKILSR